METITVKKTKVKCHRCKYEWFTESKRNWVNCPKCRTMVTIKKKV